MLRNVKKKVIIINLILKAQSGDECAFEELLNRYQNLIKSKTYQYFLPDGDKEDVYQVACIGFHSAVMSYSPKHGRSFESFASFVINRKLKTAIKISRAYKCEILNQAYSLHQEYLEGLMFLDMIPDSSYQSQIETIENPFILDEYLNTLPLTNYEKTILKLFLSNLTYRQIADSMKCDTKSIDNAMQRVRRKLAKQFNIRKEIIA